MRTCVHADMHTWIQTFLPTYLPTCLPAYLPADMHTCIHACIHAYMHVYNTCIIYMWSNLMWSSPTSLGQTVDIVKRMFQSSTVKVLFNTFRVCGMFGKSQRLFFQIGGIFWKLAAEFNGQNRSGRKSANRHCSGICYMYIYLYIYI